MSSVLSNFPASDSGSGSESEPITESRRPLEAERTFVSEAVDAFIEEVAGSIDDPKLATNFANCYPNTLDTTVDFAADRAPDGGPDTFVITGDIPAMWLRDSAAQVWPYLHLLASDEKLASMVAGLIGRHARSIKLDPYANAYVFKPGDKTQWASDITDMRPGVYERKWEVDSLAYFLRISAGYFNVTGDTAPFDDDWVDAVRLTLDTFEVQRGPDAPEAYTFVRRNAWQASDSLPLAGRGNPGRPCGLIRSSFRSSDDASVFPYLIPSNLMAAAELHRTANILDAIEQGDLATQCRTMADEIFAAVEAHGIVDHPKHGRIYAYEVDGFGGVILMDDAGIPGLLNLPYLGAVDGDSDVYQNTRRFALSDDNPYFHTGRALSGIGSPHTDWRSVWPMGIIARGLTGSDEEARECVQIVCRADAGTGFVHESVDPDHPTRFTRSWFSWVNGLFGELVCRTAGRPLFTTKFGDWAAR